ncbi:DNA-binding response regulator [Lachnoclostridium sp. An169]|uniref:response regulator transcription factor n=1 Tax=Lachnoclostridium sp. An169 TaxID=1965569 RepID=UPI000B3807FD|nr:response regulator transcription factor [Lachnoclostridium sp. An169]OUP82821.1 DNA-binding response regulator [Lachnoclostridium sp. An169]HJA67545.1 response regulator transcription factor [Candidatus Mediterraneibacter cottocaccae]
MKKILIVEDDRVLRNEVKTLLEGSGYETAVLEQFDRVPEEAEELKPDLILLDIILPGANGQAILRELREKSDVPVIMLTSRDGDVEEILSRSAGADDYITKPYNPTLLLLRIESVLRRASGQPKEEELTYRGLKISLPRSSIIRDGDEIVLSHNEMTILHCLLKNRGRIVSRDELMDYLWDFSEFVDDNTLTVNINRLRKRLASIGLEDVIETRRKQGYMLV